MIDLAIAHIISELNDYLNVRLQINDRVVSGSLFDIEGTVNEKTKNKIVVSLVNLEEERTYRSLEVLEKRPDGTSELVRPPVKISIYLLFVANLSDYREAIKSLALVISFFQHRPFFDGPTASGPGREGRMTFELFSMTFEQVNHLWGALGGKYMPSAMYKVGIVDVRDHQLIAEVPPVKEITAATQG